ncbi:hypothetical protein Pcinc_002039 [Petrolisthes cinctipes]|uniref:Uncharacterized protein n=1 Tax=Petrolisthes cinctipes TaxID=88211 RepID=A0AAE1GLQ7_PETCI|nr:hypothetical protein Pcinc_002039 [Petrolisthes cinctipes]
MHLDTTNKNHTRESEGDATRSEGRELLLGVVWEYGRIEAEKGGGQPVGCRRWWWEQVEPKLSRWAAVGGRGGA